ncbi:MAG: IclR family transcriptional regulator [Actinomycetota bacterium]
MSSLARQTGSGVVDKSIAILDAVEGGARTLSDIVEETGLTRPTAHRLAAGLEGHGMLTRLGGRGYRLGPYLLRLATVAMRELPLAELARPALESLARVTGETAQLFVRSGDRRVCVAAAESSNELRTIVPAGASLPLTAGSAGKIFLAFAPEVDRDRLIGGAEQITDRTPTGERLLNQVDYARRRGWAQSVEERESGVASVSAPVLDASERLAAVVSVSGPVQRTGRAPGRSYAEAVKTAAREITVAVGGPQ